MFRLSISRYYWLFFIAALVLLILGWSVYTLIDHPYIGITWSYTSGAIISVDQNGPAAEHLHSRDRIIAINSVEVFEARNLPDSHPGDWVSLTVYHKDHNAEIPIQLTTPSLDELAKRLSIIPVALIFWLLGTIVLAFGQQGKLVILFFLFCQAVSVILGLGAISSYAPLWAWWAFGLLLWWIGPLTFHTHLALSSSDGVVSNRKLITTFYVLAFLFSLIDINRLRIISGGPLLAFKYIWVGIFIIASASLLVYTSIKNPSNDDQRRTRIAGISAIIAFLPFVFFSLIPDALTGQFILPYEITLLGLLILPLGYSYSILLYRLVKVEREISQSAAYALATLIVVILYTFVYVFASIFFDFKSRHYSLLEILIILLMILSAHPFHHALYRWFYLIFYGGWFDDREAVKQIFQDLKYIKGDIYSIAQTLCQTLQRTMLLEYVNLLLGDGHLIKISKERLVTSQDLSFDTLAATDLFNRLQESAARDFGSGEQLKNFLSMMGAEYGSLLGSRAQLWLLVGGISNWQGLLVLGPKRGRGDFETKDLQILEVVLRQAGAAMENERLLEEVRQRSNLIRKLNRKTKWAIEVERKRIARDLHDLVIQTLVGINFQLSNVRARNDPEISDELGHIHYNLHESLTELRGICAELRPPALDVLGLVPALEARIMEIKSQVSYEIYLEADDLNGYEIRDDVALCVYRFVQEALMNVQKHSKADTALIILQVNPDDWLQLTIEDDGQGCCPPESLEVLVAQQHFGLVGLKEQVEAVGGKMEIESETGKGCQLTARIPLTKGQVPSPLLPLEIEEEMQK